MSRYCIVKTTVRHIAVLLAVQGEPLKEPLSPENSADVGNTVPQSSLVAPATNKRQDGRCLSTDPAEAGKLLLLSWGGEELRGKGHLHLVFLGPVYAPTYSLVRTKIQLLQAVQSYHHDVALSSHVKSAKVACIAWQLGIRAWLCPACCCVAISKSWLSSPDSMRC